MANLNPRTKYETNTSLLVGKTNDSAVDGCVGLVGIPAANALNYPAAILADNPIVFYRLEETSGLASDGSASGAFPGTYLACSSLWKTLGKYSSRGKIFSFSPSGTNRFLKQCGPIAAAIMKNFVKTNYSESSLDGNDDAELDYLTAD